MPRCSIKRLLVMLLGFTLANEAHARRPRTGGGHRRIFRPLPTYAELFPPPYTPTEPLLRPVLDPTNALTRDLEGSPDALRRAAEARASPERDLVIVTTDLNQLDIGEA